MGFLSFLRKLFGRNKSAPETAKPTAAAPTPKAAATSTVAASAEKTATPAKAKTSKPAAKKAYRPQCGAVTKAGDQCKSSAREGSKYCASHKGYQPPAKAAVKTAKDTTPKVTGAKDTAPATRKATKTAKAARPQCEALSKAGDQCKNSARDGSKYCGSHKGYRPPAKAVAAKAKDTKPVAKKAKDTKPSARRTQVSEGDYKLFQKGNRFFFSKKAQKDVDGKAVYEMPADRIVSKTANGLPVLKKTDAKPAAKKAAAKAPAKAAAKAPAKKAPAKKAAAKPAAKKASGSQVRHGDYRLYKAGNRYYFSKKSPGELAGSAQAVKEMPADRDVVVTSTGLPVLKKK